MIRPFEPNADSGELQRKLMDAAERLFAEQGLDATSVRDITGAAGANLGAINYHFGSKQALISAVLSRRLGPLNDRRLELIAQAEEEAGEKPPKIEALLEAMIRPVVEESFEGGKRDTSFMVLIGRCQSEPNAAIEQLIRAHFEKVMTRFGAAMGRALPEFSRDEIFWRIRFVMGTLHSAILMSGRERSMPAYVRKELDAESLIARLVAFCAAGMKAKVTR